MKKFLSIMLACWLVLFCLLTTACDSDTAGDPKGTDTTSESESTSESVRESESGAGTGGGGETNTKPVAIATLNGMTAAQLYAAFLQEYMAAETVDFTRTIIEMEDGVTSTSATIVKADAKGCYVKKWNDATFTEVWSLNNTLYRNDGTQKIRMDNTTIEALYGENYLKALKIDECYILSDSEEYEEKMATATIYSLNGEYYVTVSLTSAELNGMAEDNFLVDTLYFNEAGKMIRIEEKIMGAKSTAVIASYGVPVTVTAPADADSYVSTTPGGSEPSGSSSTAWIDKNDKVYVGIDNTNLREGPGTGYKAAKRVASGTELIRTGTNGKWDRVKLNDVEYYVDSNLVTADGEDFKFNNLEDPVNLTLNEGKQLNLRSTPFYSDTYKDENLGFSGLKPENVNDETPLLKVAVSANGVWYKVEYNSATYYIKAYLASDGTVTDPSAPAGSGSATWAV